MPNQAAKCAPNIPAFYTVYSPCEDPSRCSEAVPGCVNQSVCHHLITKNCLPGIMLIIHVFGSFGGVYPSDGAVVGAGGVKSQFLFCKTLDSLINLDGREMWRFVLPPCPPLFPPLPYFASSNWPVKTNLKNTADVRYDHAADVPRWAGLGSKRLRPCVIPWPKDAKK